ncbi:MAG: enhanced serine sensitivity protein SseB C-terminal domain-containing protein [Bacilli bacterium]|nr:enhanced serine sensitivity protein SseB C-terminal domain-containing protein [Bacilli bacterium]
MDEKIINDELKVDLMKIKIDANPETEESFKNNLLKATFIVPVVKTEKKDEVDIVLLSNPEGENFFQAYTDIDAYEKWSDYKDYELFTISFDQYANALINGDENLKGLVINPFTENVPLEREYIRYVFNSNKVSVEVITDYPKEELKVIKKVLKEVEEVKSAYLLKMYKANIPGYLLVIDTGKKNNKRIFDKIGNKVINNIEHINLEIFDINDEKVKPMIDSIKPIYKA